MLKALCPWLGKEDLERILLLQLHPMCGGDLFRYLGYADLHADFILNFSFKM